jgi:Rrf2 family protein
MKISKKSQYGLRGLFRLAEKEKHTPMKEVAKKEGISPDYLEKIFTELEKEGLIKSKRGPSGGYKLAYKPKEINLKMVIKTLENNLALVECINNGCSRLGNCPTAPVWRIIDQTLKEKLESITLQDLIDKNYE